MESRRLINGWLINLALVLTAIWAWQTAATSAGILLFLTMAVVLYAALMLTATLFCLIRLIFQSQLIFKKRASLPVWVRVSLTIWIGLSLITVIGFIQSDLSGVTRLSLIFPAELGGLSLLLADFLAYGWLYLHTQRPIISDQVIILGARLRADNSVGVLLSLRLDRALDLYAASEKQATLIVSGGFSGSATITQADAMADYLIANGVAPDHIKRESQAHSTAENFLFSRPLLSDTGQIVFVTNSYHVPRAALLAKKAHVAAQGVAALTPAPLFFTNGIREFFAVLSERRLVVISLAVLIGLLSLLFLAH
ncbi:YdcF family protein [Levilactobacillus bambusae]|uniref:DUF218 domain-containing protein n=1 Tax=Levilactobacillus bambusae TaxID=2024736 RepID=A0A2V1MYM4_9LACO|nr:YdcF family protein [Levilactobacillus bambusae]PWG00067.1 hypothetical protein DCM90_03775 [Levilactobacillus bambusae]